MSLIRATTLSGNQASPRGPAMPFVVARLPFSSDEFFALFAAYNRAVWPAVLLAYALGAVTVYLVLKPGPRSGRIVAAILAAMWGWSGIAYHWLYFSTINSAALLFAAAFVVQGGIFLQMAWRDQLSAGIQPHDARICRTVADRLRDPRLSGIGAAPGQLADRASDVRSDALSGRHLLIRLPAADDEADIAAGAGHSGIVGVHRRDGGAAARGLAGLDVAPGGGRHARLAEAVRSAQGAHGCRRRWHGHRGAGWHDRRPLAPFDLGASAKERPLKLNARACSTPGLRSAVRA